MTGQQVYAASVRAYQEYYKGMTLAPQPAWDDIDTGTQKYYELLATELTKEVDNG